jgi:predicted metal-dependent phosphoesterase TrpH/glycosyltransferase involved in cell wall biosynthesis
MMSSVAKRSDRLTIAQVTPHPWGRHEVNQFVEHVSLELVERGHRVAIAAPSSARGGTRLARRQVEAARERPESLFGDEWSGARAGGEGGPPVVSVGPGLPLPRGPRPRAGPVPIDLSRALESLLGGIEFDIVHVHDPFAPSASSVALRHSRSLNVGSFHEPSERVLSTQVARPLVEIFFGRLDARTVSSAETAELMHRYFPGSYDRVEPGSVRPDTADRLADGPFRIAFAAEEERGALRLFMRALRRVPTDLDWEAVIWLEEGNEPRMSRQLRERVRIVRPRAATPEDVIASADVLCVASGGPSPIPRLVRCGLACGVIPVASQVPIYDELLADGQHGLMFPPGDALTLAGQLERLMRDEALRNRLRKGAAGATRSWEEAADEIEEVYARLVARRHHPAGKAEIRRKISRRKQISVDLHMHTDHSPDCATPVRTLLETARDQGLGAIAITDHNEVSGALEAAEIADEVGIKVIVAEEVKTAEQGEVIGLFLSEKIERGMTMAETIAEIRKQGGLVYVPHPFDRLHSVPDYEHLLDMVEDIDILEVFNPRVALTAFNEEAERFAAKYRIVPGAGSDSHVAQGLGSVKIRVHDFNGSEEFLEAMRGADIIRKHKNLVYVQALKFIQTSGGRGGRGKR